MYNAPHGYCVYVRKQFKSKKSKWKMIKLYLFPFIFRILLAKILEISVSSSSNIEISFSGLFFVSRRRASQNFDSLADFRE